MPAKNGCARTAERGGGVRGDGKRSGHMEKSARVGRAPSAMSSLDPRRRWGEAVEI